MSDPSGAIQIVRRVIDCDNRRDGPGYRALLHDDYQSFVHGRLSTDGADFEVAALAAWWAAASDVHLEPVALSESEGIVTLRYTLEGTHDGDLFGRAATGRPFRIENCTVLQVEEGRVRRAWRYSDTLGLMTQLGLVAGA